MAASIANAGGADNWLKGLKNAYKVLEEPPPRGPALYWKFRALQGQGISKMYAKAVRNVGGARQLAGQLI